MGLKEDVQAAVGGFKIGDHADEIRKHPAMAVLLHRDRVTHHSDPSFDWLHTAGCFSIAASEVTAEPLAGLVARRMAEALTAALPLMESRFWQLAGNGGDPAAWRLVIMAGWWFRGTVVSGEVVAGGHASAANVSLGQTADHPQPAGAPEDGVAVFLDCTYRFARKDAA